MRKLLKITKYIRLNSEIFKILLVFLTWRFILIISLVFAISFIPLGFKDRFLGGGLMNYNLAPEIFSWANFDGEHYLSIAIFGYKGLEQAFFPIFPILIALLSGLTETDLFSQLLSKTLAALFISNLSFFLSLIVLWKLIKIDYSQKISFLTIILIAVFPASFYFGAVYNESLFLLLSTLAFYNARKGNWFLASIFGAISSATRIFGILLLPVFLIEAYQQKTSFRKSFWIFLIPLGLGAYMLYQYFSVGDAFAFYNLQKIVGEQHMSGLTLLPQVYFRYFKMLLTVDINNPIYQTILLEFLVGVIFFILPIFGYFKKIRLSYVLYALVGFLLPTIQGSFSSVPRYVIVFFPSFIALALLLNSRPKILRILFVLISTCFLFIETVLFLRGYWVA